MKRVVFLILVVSFSFSEVYSQSEDVEKHSTTFDLGADLVSNYIWRGLLLDASPNIQGWGELSMGNFFAGVWASTNFTGSYAETDFYVGYALGNATATFTDYFGGTDDAFNFKNDETSHVGELSLQYIVSDNFPLQITIGSVLYGADLKLDSIGIDEEAYFNANNNYSTYIELMYPTTIAEIDFEFAVGGVTHESYFYESMGAALTNIRIKALKNIKITEEYSLPISFQLSINPELQSVYSTFSISF